MDEITRLEVKLETSNQGYNNCKSENYKYREKINKLRLEKNNVDKIYNDL